MPRYKLGDHQFDRKNFYLPCIISARTKDMSDAEKAAILRETKWADLITNAEWPVVLGREGATAPNRSRLKKKMVHWMMALGRIAKLNPGLFDQALQEARKLYAKQVEEEHPIFGTDRAFKVDGHGYSWTPSTHAVLVDLPDGRTALVEFEVGRIVSAEVAGIPQPG